MKTPEAIKKGLACCADASQGACDHCPYVNDCEDFGACKLPRDALAYINQIESRVQKWISVKDRMPEIGTVVLGYAKQNPFAAYEVMLVKNLGNGFEMIRYHLYASSVTHWMTLPEMPKETISAKDEEDGR